MHAIAILLYILAGFSFASFNWLKTSGSVTLVSSLEAAGCIASLGHDSDGMAELQLLV